MRTVNSTQKPRRYCAGIWLLLSLVYCSPVQAADTPKPVIKQSATRVIQPMPAVPVDKNLHRQRAVSRKDFKPVAGDKPGVEISRAKVSPDSKSSAVVPAPRDLTPGIEPVPARKLIVPSPSPVKDKTDQAFRRKLQWREYPTDQRSSKFRQFWDVNKTDTTNRNEPTDSDSKDSATKKK